MDINSLQFSQLPAQQIPLVNQFYKQIYKKGLANKSEQVFILKEKKILCAARLKLIQGSLLLTGVACDPEYRNRGLASLLINNMLEKQQQTIFCFPYPHLQSFYEKRGFQLITEDLLPQPLTLRYQRYNSHKPLLCMQYKQT